MMKSRINTFKKSHGLTLVELMIAVTVSAILMLGVAEIFSLNKESYNVQDENARMQESGRYAFNLLMQDIRRSGYFGGNASISSITGSSSLATPDTNCLESTTTSWGRMLLRPIYGLDDTNAGYNGANGCIPDADYSQGDILVTRYTKGSDVSTATMAANPNRLYIRNSLFVGRLFVGSLEAQTTAGADNSVSETPVVVKELAANAYYVGPSGRNCRFNDTANNAIPIPALFREVLSSTGFPEREEVANGIEHIQFQYGVDINGDSSVNRYHNADELNNTATPPSWDQVVTVRLWVLVRADCPSNDYSNTKTYAMGDTPFVANDKFKRQLYSTTVTVRN